MVLKQLPVISLAFLVACSPHGGNNAAVNSLVKNKKTPTERYISKKNPLTPVNSISSSNNRCVDDFNFLRLTGSKQYQKYSHDYVKIGDGYKFLNQNKNIMGGDAKDVYTMKLDVKLDTLCTRVNYEGYQVIKEKIKELYGI
ncbi:TPA: hypothetical protein QIM62_004838 [Klebsiella aerogenes]|nr:hypothetical protein [Klebsiella aerogenes]